MESSDPVSRRQFLRLSAIGGGALLLAACGGRASLAPTSTPAPPTPVPPTPTPVPPTPVTAEAAAQAVEEKVLVGDVLDYALASDEWPGAFGFVTFTLHQALHNGEPLYHIRTDTSDPTFAEENQLVFVPLLNAASGRDIAQSYYIFSDGRAPVIDYIPGDDSYSPLFQLKQVAVSDSSLTLDSSEAIRQAVEAGTAGIEEQPIFVNYPLVKWSGGELSVDSELREYLGSGQLIEAPNTTNMSVTFKLHGCFPGTRYLITDTSAAPMAPMMSVPASTPVQKLAELKATDEIWVFGNGLQGPGVMGFQPGVFDNQAGTPAWSPFWDHFTLLWKDEGDARVLRSAVEIRAALDAGEIEQFNGTPDSHPNGFVVNCPVPVVAPTVFEA